ncbi:MAG: tetratricopeptide repeat protein [Bryobacteraceae bacterium]|jgi:tetratricopeptide (TPR) repeat protein
MKVRKLPLLLLPLLVLLVSCSRDPQSLVATGNKYFDRGKYKEASILYRRALQKDRKSAEAWYRLGLVDAKLASWGEALSAYQRAVQLNPGNTDAVARLADLYLASYLLNSTHPKQSLAETKELAKSLLQRNPNSYDGLRLAGYVALVESNPQEATKEFEAANRARPWQPPLVLALCQMLATGERAPEAEALARDMIAHDKQYGEIYDFLLRYYLVNKRVPEAEAVLEQKIVNNPKVGEYVVELARFYQVTGHRDKVEATLKRLTSNTGSYPDAWMLVGNFYTSVGDTDAALQAFSKGEAADAKNKADYQKRRVEAMVAKGQTAEASRLAEEIVKANPDDPEAVALRAVIGIQTARPEQVQKAIDDLGPLIGKYPNVPATPMLRYHLARAWAARASLDSGDSDQTRRTKDLDQARIQLEQALEDGRFAFTPARLLLAQVQMDRREYARVTQIADDILKTEPENLRARLLRTDALARMGEIDKALVELTQVLAINPNIEEAQLQLAKVYIVQRKYNEAEGILEKWQAADPRAFIDLVGLKVMQGKPADAIQILNRQLSAHPTNEALRFTLANVQVAAGKYDEGITTFRQVLYNNPKMPAAGRAEIYSRIGAAQKRKGDVNAALASYAAANKFMPNDARPIVEIALIYDQSGRPDLARSTYESALKLDPENAQAMNNLAYLKAEEQVDLDRALSLAERARQKMPDNVDVQDTLALIYVRKNLTDEALRMMRDLVGKRPNNPVYHYHLALALYQKGDKGAAKKELLTALSLKPSYADQIRIRDLMGKIG